MRFRLHQGDSSSQCRRPLLTLPVLGLLMASGPITASAQGNPPSYSNVTAQLRIGGNGTDQLIMVTNRSDQPIIVNSVSLKDCKNVHGSCSTRRLNVRVHPGVEVQIYRVRQRYPDQEFGFEYTFSWTADQPAPETQQPQAALVLPVDQADSIENRPIREQVKAAVEAAASAPAVVDTVIVIPAQLSIRTGQRLELGQALAIVSRDAEGTAIPGVRLRVTVEVGEQHAKLENGTLVGLKPGTAVLLIAPPLPPDTQGEAKGASRVIIRVAP